VGSFRQCGPNADNAATLPVRTEVRDMGSKTSATTTSRAGWSIVGSAGSRATATTSWPDASAFRTSSRPVAPVAPYEEVCRYPVPEEE
jgi:hypothetical protein